MQVQISLLIDYAHEPESLSLFLQTLQSWKKSGYFDILVHVLSSDGVGRDDWKKPIMGSLSYKYVDFTILTTDNYGKFDDPHAILALLGKNFIGKDEQLTQEWLNKLQKMENDRLIQKNSQKSNLESQNEITENEIVKNNQNPSNPSKISEKNLQNQETEIKNENPKSQDNLYFKTNYSQISKTNSSKIDSDLAKIPQEVEKNSWGSFSKNQNGKIESFEDLGTNNLGKNKPKVKFLLEIDRRKALAKALKVGLFLAQNLQILDLENPQETQTLSKIPLKTLLKSENNLTNQPQSPILFAKTDRKMENRNIENQNQIKSFKNSPQKLNFNPCFENPKTNSIKITLETDILSQILEDDYEHFEKNTFENLNSKNDQIKSEIDQNPENPKNLENLRQNKIEKSATEKKVKVLIFSTGVGCEPFLSQPDGDLAWSEKQIWQNLWREFINVEIFNQKLEQKIQSET